MRQPVFDQVVPGVGLVAAVLRCAGFGQQRWVLDPPDRAVAEAVDGFGPELVAVAVERRDVDGPAAERPEAAIAGFVAQVGVGVYGAGEDALARDLDGVPHSILYDNDRCLVSKILADGTRQRATLFSALQSHYLFHDRYGRPGKGNDKGKVEGIVGYARRNFMVPVPRFASWDAFNADLEAQCRNRQNEILRGHKETIGERLQRDLAAMKPLPGAPFEACAQASGQVSSQSLVRYETNDYSVPVAYGHQNVWVRGYVDQVVIGCRGDVIARHPRCYAREDVVFDPIHYLPLIERKINALDQAAPLAAWDLPEEFQTLRRLMEAHMLKMGRREYVQVLRLLETFGLDDLHGAVKEALRLRATGFDAVKHILLCRIEKRPPKLDLASYPYLPRADVGTTSAASYMTLMTEATG